MKQLTTILCSVLFVLAGILTIGLRENKTEFPLFPGNAVSYAAPRTPEFALPNGGLPLDVQLDLIKRANPDTVYVHNTDTVVQVKYETKLQMVRVPEVVEIHDTLSVPVFYIATPLEYEVESTEIRVIEEVQFDSLLQINQTDSIN